MMSGSPSAHGDRCKRLQEDRLSRGKDGEQTSRNERLLNGREGDSDTVNVPSSFKSSPSPSRDKDHHGVWQRP